jgi:hypothetical protein
MPSCRFFFEKRGWIDSFENRGAGEAGKLMEQGQWSVTFAISRELVRYTPSQKAIFSDARET